MKTINQTVMNETIISKDSLLDIAMISVIMGDVALSIAYDDNNPDIGYVATTEMVATWALEFYNKTKSMKIEDWEEAQISPEKFGLIGNCWDEHIIMFAEQKAQEWLHETRR